MTPVTDADREAYLAFNKLPSVLAEAVRAGEWDHLTGMQVLARHREAAEQRAGLEGAEIMREAAAGHLATLAKQTPLGHENVQRGASTYNWLTHHAQLVRSLDPAAIIAHHTRTKAMGELIAGDADLL